MIRATLTPGFRPLEIAIFLTLLACFALASCYAGMDRAFTEIRERQQEAQYRADTAFKSCLVGKTIRRDSVACEAVAQGIIQSAGE